MKDFLATLDSLVKRGLSSSLVFFSLLFVSEWVIGTFQNGSGPSVLDSWGDWFRSNLPNTHSTWAAVIMAVLLVVGLSYALSALNELIYDNTLRENFDSLIENIPFNRTVGENLRSLRSAVVRKLEADVPELVLPSFSDFYLYEIVGRIVRTPTRSYVDAAKAIGVVFVSAILVGLVELIIHFESLRERGAIGYILAVCVSIYVIGRESVKTQYRSRAIRLYVNFLMMPSENVAKKLRDELSD